MVQAFSCIGVAYLNFAETMSLYKTVSTSLFKCFGETPKISLVDNQKEGYVLKIRKKSAKKCCHCCCVRNFIENHNIQVTEDERYLTIHF